ncbi:MAG: hypothetical protein KatS3mg111_0884 [Pirellulaceae bacterium]|nr:MAG: hypothetical protein KatS3mg111_0884 [Pirellulaceae bacterium]
MTPAFSSDGERLVGACGGVVSAACQELLGRVVLLIGMWCGAMSCWPVVADEGNRRLVDATQPLRQLSGVDFGLADGAAAAGNAVFIPDVKQQRLWRYQAANKEEPWRLLAEGDGAFSATFYQLGQLYVADSRGGRIMRLDGNRLVPWVTFEDGARPNDLVVDPWGVAYVTFTRQGQVRRIEPDGSVTIVARELQTPNGIALSPDGSRLFVSLYRPGEIVSMEMQDGQLGPPQPFATLEVADSAPLADGMTVDRAGNVYCAGADAIYVWNPDGQLIDRLPMPHRPINATFGGATSQELFISTWGGVYVQPMRTYGVAPNPPMSGPAAQPPGRPSTRIPANIEARLNQVYYREGTRRLLCDMFLPQTDGAGMPAIVLVHGGGWLKGDKTKFRALALKLAGRGYVVMAIEYRLGGEAPFPAAIHDGNAAVRFLRSNAAAFNVDPDRIFAVGGSAGGHIVGLMATGWDVPELQPSGQVVLLTPQQSVAIDSRPAAAVVMAGPLQIASGSVAEASRAGSVSNATGWLGATIDAAPDRYHLADAYEKISADDPPILFLTGSRDNPQRDEPSWRRMRELGVRAEQVIHEGATHGHWNRAEWMDRVVEDICRFLMQF